MIIPTQKEATTRHETALDIFVARWEPCDDKAWAEAFREDLGELIAYIAAQHNAHSTLGESATSQAVSNAENLSTSDGVPPSAPAQVA